MPLKKRYRKIMVLTGSPRKNGNTAALVARFVAGCRSKGAKVEVVDAARLKYKTNGCIACMACQKSRYFRCVIKDEASKILARIPGFDVLVIASPVYTFGPSAQIKMLLDRTYSLVKCQGAVPAGPLTKMRFALIASAGGGPEALVPIRLTFAASARFLGIKFDSLLIPFSGESSGTLADRPEVLASALAFGERVAGR